jgi:hypothetical protein
MADEAINRTSGTPGNKPFYINCTISPSQTMKPSIPFASVLLSSLIVSLSSTAFATSTKGEFQIAQTPVMYCKVATQSGVPLRVRETPSTKSRIVGRVPNGASVAIGATDGSEGKNWARIIRPREGYVANAYLIGCR